MRFIAAFIVAVLLPLSFAGTADARVRLYWVPCTSASADVASQEVERCVHLAKGKWGESFKFGYNRKIVFITDHRARVLLATANF